MSAAGGQLAIFPEGDLIGADQPAFYPVVERAWIAIQTLDRLVGAPQGLVKVAFNKDYVSHEFDDKLNPSHMLFDVRSRRSRWTLPDNRIIANSGEAYHTTGQTTSQR